MDSKGPREKEELSVSAYRSLSGDFPDINTFWAFLGHVGSSGQKEPQRGQKWWEPFWVACMAEVGGRVLVNQ